jgi:predicted kinase
MDSLAQDLERLRSKLGPFPEPVVEPPFIVLSGLPGTGKSHFCSELSQRLPAVVIESDALRKRLYPRPTYSPEESSYLFSLIHRLIDELLGKNIPAILDATNLSERNREYLYHIAQQRGARLVLVWVEAPPALVQARLEARKTSGQAPSDADWEVYQRMKGTTERIARRHFVVDTSRDISPALEKIVREATR